MNSYCLRHTPFTIGLGLAFFLFGFGAIIYEQTMLPKPIGLGAIGIFLVLFSVLMAALHDSPRVMIHTNAFVITGILSGKKRPYLWQDLTGVEPDGESPNAGFIAVTREGRVRFPKNLSGVSELKRLFSLIAESPEKVDSILDGDYCDPAIPIVLRKNWRIVVLNVLMSLIALLMVVAFALVTSAANLIGILFFGACTLVILVQMCLSLASPSRIRLKGETLTVSWPFRSTDFVLSEIVEMDPRPVPDTRHVVIRTRNDQILKIRLNLVDSPLFDRAFYPIRFRWLKYHSATGDKS